MDGAAMDPAEPGQLARHIELHRMPGVPGLPGAIDRHGRRPGRTFGGRVLRIGHQPARAVARMAGHDLHPAPFAVIPIAMMPIVIIVGIVPGIMPVVAMPVPPIVVMEGQGHAGKLNARVGMPAIAFMVAGDIGGGRRGQRHADARGKGARGEKFLGQGHVLLR